MSERVFNQTLYKVQQRHISTYARTHLAGLWLAGDNRSIQKANPVLIPQSPIVIFGYSHWPQKRIWLPQLPIDLSPGNQKEFVAGVNPN